MRRVHEWLGRFVPKRFRGAWMHFYDAFVETLKLRERPAAAIKVVLCTTGIWFCLTAQFWVTTRGMHAPAAVRLELLHQRRDDGRPGDSDARRRRRLPQGLSADPDDVLRIRRRHLGRRGADVPRRRHRAGARDGTASSSRRPASRLRDLKSEACRAICIAVAVIYGARCAARSAATGKIASSTRGRAAKETSSAAGASARAAIAASPATRRSSRCRSGRETRRAARTVRPRQS